MTSTTGDLRLFGEQRPLSDWSEADWSLRADELGVDAQALRESSRGNEVLLTGFELGVRAAKLAAADDAVLAHEAFIRAVRKGHDVIAEGVLDDQAELDDLPLEVAIEQGAADAAVMDGGADAQKLRKENAALARARDE